MVRKFALGERAVYCGECAAVPVCVVGYVEGDGGLGLPLYWVCGLGSRWVCSENWLESEVA